MSTGPGTAPPEELLHYTLNTGHTRSSLRAEVSDLAIQHLQPVIERGGEIPGTPGLSLTMTRYPGGALFTVWQELPLINGAFAWTGTGSEIWEELVSIYHDIYGQPPRLGMKAPQMPVKSPWLGIVILPPLLERSPKSQKAVSILGDLERCIAWTFYECEFGARRQNHVAKLIRQTGQVVPIQPNNGTNFTLMELQALVGGGIQIIHPPSAKGAIMVINENGKMTPGLQKNLFASEAWQQFCDPDSPRSLDDVFGDVLVCHTTQIH